MKKISISTASLLKLLGPVIFFSIVVFVGPEKILSTLYSADLMTISTALILTLTSIPVKTLRWKYLLNKSGINITFRQSLNVYAESFAWGILTPGQLGEFSKVTHLSRMGFDTKVLLKCSVFDRIFDVFILGCMVIIGCKTLFPYLNLELSKLELPIILPLLIIAFSYLGFRSRKTIVQKLKINLVNTYISLKSFAWLLTLTVLAWIAQYISVYLCSYALKISIDPMFFFAVYFVSIFLSMLPISISGLGTRDASYFYFFTQVGVRPEETIALSTFVFCYKILSAVLIYTLAQFPVLEKPTQKN